MLKKVINKSSGVLLVVGLILMLSAAGGADLNTITTGQAAKQAFLGIALVVLAYCFDTV